MVSLSNVATVCRALEAGILCVCVIGCSGPASSNAGPTPQGSVRVAPATPPPGDAGQITFTGAVTGTSHATHQACDVSPGAFGQFTATSTGDVGGLTYFLSVAVYPYRGVGTYELRPAPSPLLYHVFTPDPLRDNRPGGYPGFLNFVPKYEPGHAFSAIKPQHATMTIDEGERSGWFDVEMVSVNAKTAETSKLRIAGRFGCGPPFTM